MAGRRALNGRLTAGLVGGLTEPDMYAAHRLYQRRGYVRRPGRDWQAGRFRLMVFRLEL